MSSHQSAFRRLIVGHARLFISIGFGLLIIALLPESLRLLTRLVLGWDAITLSYVITTGFLMIRSDVSYCRHRAALYDEGDWIILISTMIGAIASFFAIISELGASKAAGQAFLPTFIFTATTVALSWVFTHMIFALHYANLYYRTNAKGEHGGLLFPGEREPDYRDFLYYAFAIACAAQTADVSTLSPAMRRVTLVHCVTAFAFNSAILALMINITAGSTG